MSPEAQNDIKMHFYDFYQINLYGFNKFQIYFINYSGTPVANTGKLRSIGQVHVISTSDTTFELLLLLTGYFDVVLKTKSIMDKL
jgi:hypothetical protein